MRERVRGGLDLGAASAVGVVSRSAHSSTVFGKRSGKEGDAEGVPASSIADRRAVVEWGPNEKSRL